MKPQPVFPVFCLILAALWSNPSGQVTVNITMDSTYQTITGFGDMADNTNGLSDELTDLKISAVRIFFDPEYNGRLEPQNDNADPNTLDLTKFVQNTRYINPCKQAKAAGVKFFMASVLSPPTWMKSLAEHAYADQNQWQCPIIRGLCGGYLLPSMYDEFGEWIEGCILSFRRDAGFDLNAVSLQNEPNFPEPYGSCVYTALELRDALKKVGQRLSAKGITTKIILPEEVIESYGSLRGYITTACDDTSANRYMSIIGYHGYASDGITAGSINPPALASLAALGKRYGKGIYMTETSGYAATVAGAMAAAYGMLCNFAYGNGIGWNYYYLTKSAGMVYYAHKNFARYIQPGAVRIKAASSDTGMVGSVGFRNTADSTVTIVMLNRGTTARQVTIAGSSLPDAFNVYTTSAAQNCVANGTAVRAGGYQVTLPAGSVTTLNGVVSGGFTSARTVSPARFGRELNAGSDRIFDILGRCTILTDAQDRKTAVAGIYLTSSQDAGPRMVRITR